MSEDDPLLARNSCPLCEQPTHVPLLQFLPSQGGERGFRCSSCHARISVAGSTRQIAMGGGLLALGATLVAAYWVGRVMQRIGLLPEQGLLLALIVAPGILGLSVAFPFFAAPFGRRALRLEPTTTVGARSPGPS